MKKRTPAYIGMFLALALVCSYAESLIPFHFGIPGVKLGLTNIVVILMIYDTGVREALTVSVLRIVLAGFLFGSMSGILYSLAGGLLSFFFMAALKRTGKFKLIAVSAVGGVTHNLGQLVIAAAVVENLNMFYYFPVLLCAGLTTGIVIGIIAQEILFRLPKQEL